MNLQETLSKVQQWGAARLITVNGNSITQAAKLFEEVSELATGVLNEDQIEIKDAIGDALVVTSMIADLDGYKINFNKRDILYREHLRVIQDGGDMVARILRSKEYQKEMNEFVQSLDACARENDLTLEECFEHAYNEIKDRTGHLTPEGNFVKDETPLPGLDDA